MLLFPFLKQKQNQPLIWSILSQIPVWGWIFVFITYFPQQTHSALSVLATFWDHWPRQLFTSRGRVTKVSTCYFNFSVNFIKQICVWICLEMDRWLKSGSLKCKTNNTLSGSSVVENISNADKFPSHKKSHKYCDSYWQMGSSILNKDGEDRSQCCLCFNVMLSNESMKLSKFRCHLETKHNDIFS